MKTKTLAVAPTMEKITAYVNEYFYSKYYEVLDNGTIHNTKTGKALDGVKVISRRNGYKFVALR